MLTNCERNNLMRPNSSILCKPKLNFQIVVYHFFFSAISLCFIILVCSSSRASERSVPALSEAFRVVFKSERNVPNIVMFFCFKLPDLLLCTKL